MLAKSLKLQHTIRLNRALNVEIAEIEGQFQSLMYELHSPITSIPCMGFHMVAIILAEIGDYSQLDSPDKLLASPGCRPLATNPDSSRTDIHTWKKT